MVDFPTDPDAREAEPSDVLLTIRPRKIAIYAAIGASAVILVGIFVALKLRSADTGVIFRTSDALAMVGLGLLFAGGLLLTARPRLRAYPEGLRVRNIVGERFVSWVLIERIAFPEGAVWAQLQLADDELMSVMAIQSMDKQRAVDALKRVRSLHERYAPPRPLPAVRTSPESRPARRAHWVGSNRSICRRRHSGRERSVGGSTPERLGLRKVVSSRSASGRLRARSGRLRDVVGVGPDTGRRRESSLRRRIDDLHRAPGPARPVPPSTRGRRPGARPIRPGKQRRAVRGRRPTR